MFRHKSRAGAVLIAAGLAAAVTACSSPTPAPSGEDDSTVVNAGWVSAIDQIGLPAALDEGFFEAQGLDVELAEPFATGVDQLNALETDQIQFAQVGAPIIGAVLSGADYVIVGNYTGSAAQFGIDETMAVMARAGSDIEVGDLASIEGKRIGVAVGSINHLYLLSVLESLGLAANDVELVNTAPPDMAVALQTSGIDAAIVWDPWPLLIEQQVEGSYQVARGGGYIGYLGYIVAKRSFVEQNPDTVERFLAARAEADQWMRENPSDAALVASRWLSSLDPEIATAAMEFNVRQLDPRISACNYAALDQAITTLNELGSIDGVFDVNDVFAPTAIGAVEATQAGLFSDLAAVPDSAAIGSGFVFDPSANQCDR